MTRNYQICEHGVVRKASDFSTESKSDFLENVVYVPDKSFDSLLNFVLDNQDLQAKDEAPFVIFRKGSHQQIKVKNYVGVIETKDGTSLEILPKIYSPNSVVSVDLIKQIFIRMLMRLRDTPFKRISDAHLYVKRDFPILEVFIDSFIRDCEHLFNSELRRSYVDEESNLNRVKGKLLVANNIKHNACTKTKFFCSYSDFTLNIPQNRLIKSTLIKLYKSTRNHSNLIALKTLINRMEMIDPSVNIVQDLIQSKVSNRLFLKYRSLIRWAEVFLLNKSFTNFRGNSINSAILFPMEKVFEDYVVSLFREYAAGFKIKAHDRSYFLVERHLNSGAFRLIPDLYLENELVDRVIVDTKWKLIDESVPKQNYNIKSSDMYQLYAYGKKYTYDLRAPRLALVYPLTNDFKTKLASFHYEGDLTLEVIPFDLTASPKEEIQKLLSIIVS